MLDLPTRPRAYRMRRTFADVGSKRATRSRDRPRVGGLTGRILIVTVSAVIVSMAVAFTTRIEAARENWLNLKIETVRAALDAFDPDEVPLPPELASKVLSALGVESIAVLGPHGRREIASASPPPPEATVDLSRDDNALTCSLPQLYRTLLAQGSTHGSAQDRRPPSRARSRPEAALGAPAADRRSDVRHLGRDRRSDHPRGLADALARGSAARAQADHQHRRFRRTPAGRLAHHPAERKPRRDRPRRKGARRHAAIPGARARAEKADGRARDGGRADQPRLAQHSVRRAAHLGSSRDNPRPAGPAPRAEARRHARSGDPVLPGDPDLRRRKRAAARASAVRSEQDGAGGGGNGPRRARRGHRLRCRHPSPVRDLRRSGPHSSRDRESQPERRAGADGQRLRGRTPEGDPFCGDPYGRNGPDRDQRHRPRISIGPEGPDLRTVPQVDERDGDRARPVDRRRSRDPQRRLDRTRAVQGRGLLLRRTVPHQTADARARRRNSASAAPQA